MSKVVIPITDRKQIRLYRQKIKKSGMSVTGQNRKNGYLTLYYKKDGVI